MKYKRNFLRSVIVRADFLSPILDTTRSLPDRLQGTIKTKFPIPERTEIQVNQVQLGSLSITPDRQSKMTQFDFYTGDRLAHLGIGGDFLFIEESRYDGYEAMCSNFLPVLDAVFDLPGNPTIRRLGLRYQNLIPAQGKNPLDWSGHINSKLLTSIAHASASCPGLCRAMTYVEFNDSDTRLIFQYGIVNQDYPAPIRRKEFTLDLDSFVTGIVERQQLQAVLNQLHSRIETTFEESILERLRKIMVGDD